MDDMTLKPFMENITVFCKRRVEKKLERKSKFCRAKKNVCEKNVYEKK